MDRWCDGELKNWRREREKKVLMRMRERTRPNCCGPTLASGVSFDTLVASGDRGRWGPPRRRLWLGTSSSSDRDCYMLLLLSFLACLWFPTTRRFPLLSLRERRERYRVPVPSLVSLTATSLPPPPPPPPPPLTDLTTSTAIACSPTHRFFFFFFFWWGSKFETTKCSTADISKIWNWILK